MRSRLGLLALGLLLLVFVLYTQRAALGLWAFNLTGETASLSQVRALWHLTLGLLRPPLDLQPEVPIAHNGVNPFGINTFLQQEVEVAKRERQAQLIAQAGFTWIRQEFPWADLEISGKGNFQDCRNNGQCLSAWDKYDNIVDLAARNHLTIIARLSSPPTWSRADGDARGAFAPPDHVSDFADYAQAVAERYRGRLRYFQVWNEPNIYPEWGDQPADPEAYTRLLCATYQRLKRVDPDIVVLSGVLAPTNQLGDINPATQNAAELSDFVFLQRMYNAGAQACFDVLTVQGYGLWSGPTDQRDRPLVVNYGRNEFIRDLMVQNGDAHKAIWIAEMNWNAVPEASGIDPSFGRVTEAEQARYAPLAYQRQQAEWPWVGVNAFWFFKRASDAEKNQAWYYFRMADPDFTLKPVYAAMQAYTHQPAVMYPGWFQEDHWAVQWSGDWQTVTDPAFTLGAARQARTPGAAAHFLFSGTDLLVEVQRGPQGGVLTARVDGQTQTFDLYAEAPTSSRLSVARGLPDGQHTVELVHQRGLTLLDGFIVRRQPDVTAELAVGAVLALAGAWWISRRLMARP